MKMPLIPKRISRKFLSELFTEIILRNKFSKAVFLKVCSMARYFPGVIILSQFKIN